MKLTVTAAGIPTLHLESDDGLHAYGVIDLERGVVDRRSLSATGVMVQATVAAVNAMFHVLDKRRRQEPDIGARMRLRGTDDAARTVVAMDTDLRVVWFEDDDYNLPGTSWEAVEYEP